MMQSLRSLGVMLHKGSRLVLGYMKMEP